MDNRCKILRESIDKAKDNIIRIDIEVGFLEEESKNSSQSLEIKSQISEYIEVREQLIRRLGYLQLRKEEYDREAIIFANNVKNTFPSEVKVDFEKEK